MAALPKSPAGGRRSSGTGLRPVIPFGLDSGNPVDLDEEEDDIGEMGHAPREDSAFASGGGVDEVEYAYGYVGSFSLLSTLNVLTRAASSI